MKCNKCGYDWGDSGDSAHVCGVVAIKKQWVGLTDEDKEAIYEEYVSSPQSFIEITEAKLKEKNT